MGGPRGTESSLEGRPLALVGMRCSGKSTVAVQLAARLERTVVDLDDEVVALARREGRAEGIETAGDLLAAAGQPAFRDLEERAFASVLSRADAGRLVIATGGGVVERPGNRDRLAAAITVWLDAPVEVLAARMRADSTPRPALGAGESDPVAELAGILERRRGAYEQVADHRISAGTASVGALVVEIVSAVATGAD